MCVPPKKVCVCVCVRVGAAKFQVHVFGAPFHRVQCLDIYTFHVLVQKVRRGIDTTTSPRAGYQHMETVCVSSPSSPENRNRRVLLPLEERSIPVVNTTLSQRVEWWVISKSGTEEKFRLPTGGYRTIRYQ